MASSKHLSKHLFRWDELQFYVKPKDIIGIRDISITGSCDTEEKESDGEKFATHKAAKPIELSMKVTLNTYLTDHVQRKALNMVKIATEGRKGYIYMGKSKLMPCRFMLVSAKPSKISIAAGVKWVSCEVDLSFRQCSKYDGSEAPQTGSKSGSKKQSVGKANGKFFTGFIDEAKRKIIKDAIVQNKKAKKQSYNSLGVKVYAARQGKQGDKGGGGGIRKLAMYK